MAVSTQLVRNVFCFARMKLLAAELLQIQVPGCYTMSTGKHYDRAGRTHCLYLQGLVLDPGNV